MPQNRSAPKGYTLLWIIAGLSLLLNVLLIAGLLLARERAAQELNRFAAELEDSRLEDVELTISVDETLPVQLTVNFNDTVRVPIRTTIPVSTTVLFEDTIEVPIRDTISIDTSVRVTARIPIINQNVPIDLPIRTDVPINLDVSVPIRTEIPVRTDIPVNLTVNVPIAAEIPIDEEIPVQLDFPVTVPLAETGVPALLDAFAAGLRRLAGE